MFVERTQDTDTHRTRLTVEPHSLVSVLTTLYVLLRLHVEQRVTACYLHHRIATISISVIQIY